MSRQAKGPDGVIHNFPDDATDAEIADALDSAQPKADPNQTPAVLNMGMRQPGGYETQDFAPPASPTMEALRSSAHPGSVKDLLPLLLPNAANLSGVTLEMLGSWFNAAKRAIPEAKTLRGLPIETLKMLYADAFPSESKAAQVVAAVTKPAANAERSALNYLTGNAMVDATPAERMLLAKQRLALKELASLKQLGR